MEFADVCWKITELGVKDGKPVLKKGHTYSGDQAQPVMQGANDIVSGHFLEALDV